MREIKFRAWDGDYKEMLYGNAIEENGADTTFHEDDGYVRQYHTGLSYGSLFVGYYDEKSDWQNCEIMQFTGLLDKNGTPIFEGDVVLCSNQHKGVVEWEHRDACFNVTDYYSASDDYSTMAFMEGQPFVVLGNIHENPELLEAE